MVFIAPSSPVSNDSDTEMGGKRGFRRFFPRMAIAAPSSPAVTDSDTESGGMIKLLLRLDLNSRIRSRALILNSSIRNKALRLMGGFPGVVSVALCGDGECLEVSGFGIDPVQMLYILRKKNCYAQLLTVDFDTARNDTFPTRVSITELEPNEDTDLERKTSVGMLISEEQQEQSEKQQEDQPPPQQTDYAISQVEASLHSHPLPSMSLPLASEARPSPSPVSSPSQGMSDQMQATPDHASELSFPFATSSLPIRRTESLADMPAYSSISGGACLPRDMELMEEEEGPGGHDQLYDSVVHHLLSGINGIGELKRHYDLHAGEQATRLEEAEDTTIMLRERVKELEAKLSMANTMECCLKEMLRISEHRHAETQRELALMREKMDKASRPDRVLRE